MAPVEALPVPSAALRLESMLEMAAQSEPRASAAPLPAPAAVETPTVHGAGAGQADPLRSIPALPAPLIDRILCFCTLRDFPRLALANKAVARAARQPHVLAELFRNTYHPSLALLKALGVFLTPHGARARLIGPPDASPMNGLLPGPGSHVRRASSGL